MKTKIFFFVIIILIAGTQHAVPLQAQNYFQDTVWMRKTDQVEGFYMVKFSDNDSIIVGHGLENDLFFDSFTGQEIFRLSGMNEVIFINNDNNFVRLNKERTKFEIFDTKTFLVTDTLESGDMKINDWAPVSISKDQQYLVAPISHGFRIWDLNTKNILKTKIIQNEINLIYYEITTIDLDCNNRLIGHLVKTFQDPNYPGDPNHFKTYGSFVVYDFITLDSIDNYLNARYIEISENCKYIANATGDPTYGVEVYDFNTKELIWKLPINGPSLTGIEFSSDDKYLVTTSESGLMRIWDLATSKGVYDYKDGGYGNIDISNDGKYIVTSIGRYLFLYPAKWEGTPVVPEEDNPIIIYPNPTNGMVTINFEQLLPELTTINLRDLNGVIIRNLFNNFLEYGPQIHNFDVSDLANGSYYINVNNSHLSLFFKLIINK